MARQALQVALGRGPRHHWHPLERVDFLRPEKPERQMTKPVVRKLRRGVWRDPNPASLVKFVRCLTGVDDPD